MNASSTCKTWLPGRVCGSITAWLSMGMFAIGLALGVSVHHAWLIVAALGAFGPGVLRQCGLLHDHDELQQQAAARAGLRAYLTTGIILMAVVIVQTWDRLDLGTDVVPASLVLTVALVVYYASYCLSFWEPRIAVSRVLATFGIVWLVFVLMSHATEPLAALGEGLLVPGPFLLAAVLCRRWPRLVGVALLAMCAWSIYFFHLWDVLDAEARNHAGRMYVIALIPLPLAVAGIALLAAPRDDERPAQA